MSALSHVPFWVWILFVVFMRYAWSRTQTRVVKISRLLLMPVAFLYLSLQSVVKLPMTDALVGIYGAALLLGGLLGYLMVMGARVRCDREQGLIEIPGQYSLFILLVAIFILEFGVHFVQGAGLPLASSKLFQLAVAGLEGSLAGMTCGRNIYYGYQYISMESSPLEPERSRASR
ncbi:DUF6622 family protein [Dongshaea marina]|uniref:DUF6622 family protein n=1 Tax=Dongshaea marina TaxID=2047966 RepID=UPI000D3EA2B0|nr:DUF6622 family protein [Dongshaea marina]